MLIPLVLKHWKAGIAVFLVAAVMGYVVTLQRQIAALTGTIEAQKTEMAQMRQAMQKLADAAAALRPGETRTIYVDRPFMVQVPGQTITREVPVVVTRTEHTIETRVETLRLPGEKITEFIEKSPQSIVATMTALRPIAQGEKFSATFVQLQPGVWQPLVTPDSPIGIEAKVITPIERIPAPAPTPSRWTTAFLLGPDAFHPRGATVLTRAEIEYRLSPRLFTRAEVAWHWNGAGASGLLLLGTRF